MNIDQQLKTRLDETFRPLNTRSASKSLPGPGTLSNTLTLEEAKAHTNSRSISPTLASHFGTAAVEIWQRSVHSFLISTSLTDTSPIWASVTGYYSSHYSVRGIAHLLGYFYLYRRQKVARLEFGNSGGCKCLFLKRPKGVSRGGEHQVYWALVKQDSLFTADPFFTDNKQDADESDAGHRNYANYADHIGRYPVFHPLDRNAISDRIERISKFPFDDPPLPRRTQFPDVTFVQLIAYHRIVCFRRILDEALGATNRFWSVQRTPSFAVEFMDYQLTEGSGLTLPS